MTTKAKIQEVITIAEPNFQTMDIHIRGNAPMVQNRFSKKAATQMLQTHIEGSSKKNKSKVKEARDIEQDYKDATHIGEDGKFGIPAPAFRSAMISACRVAGFVMTKAKLSVFVVADSVDREDGSPLVHINGDPEMHTAAVRLPNGSTSIAIRPMWRKWSAVVRVRWDGDQFTSSDVTNLMMRAGMQVGVGEGRPDSKKSNGMGWGTFDVITEEMK